MTREIRSLNNWLIESYGKTPTGKVRFRVVWSEDIFEMRKGAFNEFYGNIFLREIIGIQRVKKYNFINNRFILEGWVDADMSHNGEVPEAKGGDFTAIYVFENNKREPLPVTRKALAFMVASVQGRIKKDEVVSEQTKEDKEIESQVDKMLDAPDFRTHGTTRDSIAYTKGLKEKEDFKENVIK
jgi:hypothetical protein